MAYFHSATPIAAIPMADLITDQQTAIDIAVAGLPRMTASKLMTQICDKTPECPQHEICLFVVFHLDISHVRCGIGCPILLSVDLKWQMRYIAV